MRKKCLLLQWKAQSVRGASHHPAFMGNCQTISHTFYSLDYPVDEFSLKEMRMWVSPRFHLIVFLFGVNQGHCFGLNPRLRGEYLMYTALTKILEHEGSISPSNFHGQLPNYWSHVKLYLPSG